MKELTVKFGIATGLFVLTLLVFFLLQNPFVYKHSLGLISKNYVNHGDWNVERKAVPFVSINEDNLNSWDAEHYRNIRDYGYDLQKGSHEWAYAFFPLFPYIWKFTGLNAAGICIFNYLLFALAIILLSYVFLPVSVSRELKWMIFILALLLPGTVVYTIPYTEAVFIFAFSIAIFGLKKGMKWLFLLGFFLVGMSRPAMTILLASMIASDLYFAFTGNRNLVKPGSIAMRILPVIAGTFAAMAVQYHFSGEWFKFMEIQKAWGDQRFQIPKKLGDWSEEGFGMTVFFLFAVMLPAIFYLVKTFFKKFRIPSRNTAGENKDVLHYYFILSMFYCAAASFYIIFFRGGSLNGLQRYVGATPMFYIVFFTIAPKLVIPAKRIKGFLAFTLLAAGIGFMTFHYDKLRFTFPDAGFYLFFFILAFLMYRDSMSFRLRTILFGFLVCALVIWKTYLFNMFLSSAWIFT